MTDRPILFSTPMVRALLAGRKMQTRRIGDRPRIEVGDRLWVREAWRAPKTLDALSPADMPPRRNTLLFEAGGSIANQDHLGDYRPSDLPHYGSERPGWIGRLRASMHLPRWASRLTLRVDEVRIQRLQEISESDCLAEGITKEACVVDSNCDGGVHREVIENRYFADGVDDNFHEDGVSAYARLWDHINGKGAWDKNPLVIAYSFTVHRGNIDSL